MFKIFIKLFVLFTFHSCAAANAQIFSESDSSLVTIESTYTDQISKKEVKIRGTGFIVKAKEQYFVLTASHVSQGTNLKVISQDQQEFEVIQRYYPRKSDIELIEIKATPRIQTHFEYVNTAIIWKSEKNASFRQIDSESFVLKNSWIKDDNQFADNDYVTKNTSYIMCDMYCLTLSSESLIQPGYSGSPLISKLNEPLVDAAGNIHFDLREGFDIKAIRGQFFLRGLAIKRDRFFAVSSFVSSQIILKTINEFLTKQPARTDSNEANTWLLKSNVLIRKIDYNSFEASAIGGVVGNGVSMDGGDDLLNSIHDSPNEIMKKVGPFPTTDQQEEMYFWFMLTRSHAGELYSAVSWFDAETYQYVKRFNFSMDQEKKDFVTMFSQRLFNLDLKKPILSKDQNSKIVFSENSVSISVNVKIPFQLTIHSNGKICHSDPEICTEKFTPLIEVLANDKKTWLIVDLRLLLFYDVATGLKNRYNNTSIQKMSDEEYNKYSDQVMVDEMTTLTLKYRKKQNLNRVLTIEELKSENVIWKNWK